MEKRQMSNAKADTCGARKRSNGTMIFRRLSKNHETDLLRTYTILYDIEEPPIELNFSKKLSVNRVIRFLKLFIEDLRHEGFETPLLQIEVEPTEEEGVYRVPEGFSMPKR
jgi:hypothetical protein